MHRLALAPALLAAACGGSSGPDEVKSDLARNKTPSTADVKELVDGNAAFAADLYGQIRTQPGNLFFSPHSISTALSMTYAGAATTTATQMATALHYTLPPAQLYTAFDALDLALASRATAGTSHEIPFQLHTANSLWGQTGATFLAPFLDTLAVNYGAGMHVEDFGKDTEGARTEINDWVADQTNEKIKDLIPRGAIDGSTRFVLTNAIYFTAAWATPFDAANTTNDVFHAAGGDVTVPTLHQVVEATYTKGDGWDAAALPYDGGQLEMVVVEPADLAAFEATITTDTFESIASSLTGHDVTLSLPKFEFKTPIDLGAPLQALGMRDAFTEAADFSPIDGVRDLEITAVLHQGFIHIDEKGSEAAAATAVIGGDASAPAQATLVVDRPFLFFIRDNPTGAILFVGRVVDPSK